MGQFDGWGTKPNAAHTTCALAHTLFMHSGGHHRCSLLGSGHLYEIVIVEDNVVMGCCKNVKAHPGDSSRAVPVSHVVNMTGQNPRYITIVLLIVRVCGIGQESSPL